MMSPAADSVTLQVPRSSVEQMVAFSESLTERMHELLERNTEGDLSPIEREELQTLVCMSQFSQLLSLALAGKASA